MRVALFGSPAFAVPSLHALAERHEIALVVTQPDKPARRGLALRAPAVAEEARRLGLRLEQPAKLKGNRAFRERLAAAGLDVAVTAAYGKILPPSLLEIPEHGFLNVHASLLPKYRGAAPIQWALIRGERETGVSIVQTEAGLDTGPVRHAERLPIEAEDTALTLFDKLAALGAEALLRALELLEAGELPCRPQDEAAASYAPLLTKDDGRVRWAEGAQAIHDRFRGVILWPGSWTTRGGQPLKIRGLEPASGAGEPGTVLAIAREGVTVAAGDGAVRLTRAQPPNKAAMAAYDWANGYRVEVGERLGCPGERLG